MLTIGFFDGIHQGHQKIFSKLREIKQDQGYSYTLTFSNHPKNLVRSNTPVPLISTLNQRLELIEEQGVDFLILLEFTEQIKERSADDFILELIEKINFTDLVLGPDSTIGKDKKGDIDLIKLLSKKYSFNLHQLTHQHFENNPISSTLIREKIKEGDFPAIENMLGRPYSILATTIQGAQKGELLGFPTLNFEVNGLCLPPCGVYKVWLKKGSYSELAIANLGYAPTLQERKSPILEVHCLESTSYKYGDELEIIFEKFLRSEKKFHSLDELKEQISLDVKLVQSE